MSDPKELVAKLRAFQTRKETMDRLIEMREQAVEPLVEALQSRTEGMRWAAMRCLGEIGDERAIDPLLDRLGVFVDRDTACWALARITGRDYGSDYEAWRQWRASVTGTGEPKPTAEQPGPTDLDNDTLFTESVKGLAASVQMQGERRSVTVTLPEGRHQEVRVVLDAKDLDGEAMVLVYSECAPANPDDYATALKLNLSLPYGALALREVRGEDRLVMFNSMLRKGLTPLALRKSIVAIAGKADVVEKRFTGQDLH